MVVFHKSCGFVIFKEDNGIREYLLLHYPGGHWDYVKGHVEEGEDEITTATRELEEETGIDKIEVMKGFMNTMNYNYKHEDEMHEKVVDFFLAKALHTDVTLSHEHTGFVWLPFEESLKKLTFDNAKDVLIAAEGFMKSYE